MKNKNQRTLILFQGIIIILLSFNLIFIILRLIDWNMDWYYGYFETLKMAYNQCDNTAQLSWAAINRIYSNIKNDLTIFLFNTTFTFICFLFLIFYRKK